MVAKIELKSVLRALPGIERDHADFCAPEACYPRVKQITAAEFVLQHVDIQTMFHFADQFDYLSGFIQCGL